MVKEAMDIFGLVIHLPRAAARRPLAARLRDGCGLPCTLLDAVDGTTLSAAEIAAAYRPGLHAPRYPFALRPGEIGCFLSHRAAWARLVAGSADAALILEDDVDLAPGTFADALALAARHVADIGYIQLQTRPVTGTPVDGEGAARLYRPALTPLRTSAQLVGRAAAERLLGLTAPFDRPVDTFVQMHWLTGLRLGAVFPAGLADATEAAGGSTIGQKKGLGEKIAREWTRGRYRAAVKRLSAGEGA